MHYLASKRGGLHGFLSCSPHDKTVCMHLRTPEASIDYFQGVARSFGAEVLKKEERVKRLQCPFKYMNEVDTCTLWYGQLLLCRSNEEFLASTVHTVTS